MIMNSKLLLSIVSGALLVAATAWADPARDVSEAVGVAMSCGGGLAPGSRMGAKAGRRGHLAPG